MGFIIYHHLCGYHHAETVFLFNTNFQHLNQHQYECNIHQNNPHMLYCYAILYGRQFHAVLNIFSICILGNVYIYKQNPYYVDCKTFEQNKYSKLEHWNFRAISRCDRAYKDCFDG